MYKCKQRETQGKQVNSEKTPVKQ